MKLIDKDDIEHRKKRRFKSRKYTNEELLEHLKQFYRENGKVPCVHNIGRCPPPSDSDATLSLSLSAIEAVIG